MIRTSGNRIVSTLARAACHPTSSAGAARASFHGGADLSPLNHFRRLASIDPFRDLHKELQRMGFDEWAEPAMRIDFVEVRARACARLCWNVPRRHSADRGCAPRRRPR